MMQTISPQYLEYSDPHTHKQTYVWLGTQTCVAGQCAGKKYVKVK